MGFHASLGFRSSHWLALRSCQALTMQQILSVTMETPLGPLEVAADERAISGIRFAEVSLAAPGELPPHLRACLAQLEEYFAGTRRSFDDLPLRITGSDFSCSVWDRVSAVPYGSTATYKQIASGIGSGDASRAVGGAVGRNTLCIVIPCHRIVPSSDTKDLGGYAWGPERKQWLLDHEKRHVVKEI